jgi:hypothetical protein
LSSQFDLCDEFPSSRYREDWESWGYASEVGGKAAFIAAQTDVTLE